jgi:hypothetical protein
MRADLDTDLLFNSSPLKMHIARFDKRHLKQQQFVWSSSAACKAIDNEMAPK